MKEIIVRPNGTKKVVTINNEPSRTSQQWKDIVDVNNIMKKYKKTGTVTHLRNAENGVYMDLTEIQDYMGSLLQIKKAEEAFQQIPAVLRQRFNQDPSQLISYLQNPENHDEAIKLGLIKKPNDEQKPKPNDEQKPLTPKPST